MKDISQHISYSESVHSDIAKRLGIRNIPNKKQLLCMQNVATHIFEPLRDHFGIPIYISSFYRSSALNKAVGGAISTQHLKGEAVDVDGDFYGGVNNRQIFDYIKDNLVFDQLVGEDLKKDGSIGWVHFSLKEADNRGEVLTMTIINGKKYYEEYIK